MFPWKIAKSAEAMFSRWAVKRVCKFLLKKKLGQFILGDIDLDQLDVQLSNGTIQLTDLALNADFLNNKLSAAAGLYIKEGSIGSLLLKMPWNGKGCQLELDEFEVVLAPCKHNSSPDKDGVKNPCQDSDSSNNSTLEKHEKEMLTNIISSSDGDVHEGVKIIAKMVKWLLSSFHVKIKKLIVAYDPHFEQYEDRTLHHKMMVLRIEEIECGTCLFEDVGMQATEGVDNIFGMSRLSNYVTFDGAIVELVEVDDVIRETCCPSATGTSSSDSNFEILPSYSRKPIISGKGGGFSGNLKLSIPWLNGSLDIQKVDADICIDPIDLRFDPSSIKWLLISWETFKYLCQGEKVHHNPYESTDSVQLNSISCSSSPTIADDGFSSEVSPLAELGSIYDLKLPHLISDWVPSSVDNVEKDFDASVDQFFSCIDGMRSTQSALGGSGVWNWTCSVFNALTATSSLASGSLPIPSEQQNVETNLKVTVAGISLMFCFQNESEDLLRSGVKLCQEKTAYNYHYLALECADISLILKICPRDLKLEGSIRSIEVDHYICQVDHDLVALRGLKYDFPSKTCMIQQLQSKVEDALPRRASSVDVSDKTSSGAIPALDIPSRKNDDVVKVTLFRTSGILHCKFLVKYGLPNDNSATSLSFSLKLPPFVFWVNFHLIAKMLIFMKEVQSVVQLSDARRKSSHEVKFPRSDNSRTGLASTREGGPGPCFTTLSSEERLQGIISVPEARIILCAPSKSDVELATYSSWEWDHLIALDLYSPFGTNEDCNENLKSSPDASSDKRFSLAVASSLRLNVGNLDVSLITSATEDDHAKRSATSMVTRKFTSHKLVSVANGAGYSVIQVIWQDGPVTGPWIVERAKSSAWSKDAQSRNKFMQEHDFISATAVKDLDDSNCQIRQEIILSSAILVHVHLVPVVVHLDRPQYEGIHCLINQMVEGFTSRLPGGGGYAEASAKFQTSILVECESLEFVVKPDKITDLKSSMQSELPGSWCKLTLKVKKFELVYTSDLGGINGANFFWLSHGEGKLLGSITSVPGQEFLLISCSDSTIKRGDGEGSNALSSGFSGLDVASLHDPRSSHGYLSITVRGATVIANGGRLDWLDAISSFFALPSAETEYSGGAPFSEADCQPSSTSWFALNLVDVAMSYEPYLNKLVLDCRSFDSASIHSSGQQKVEEHCVACILAVSSLNLTHTAEVGSSYNEYVIGVQDMGVLLCAASELESLLGVYSAQRLRKVGFVKIAGVFQAKLRTYSVDGIKWHLECSNSEINMETCHDTTSALIKLSSQLQQLFAPDIEESLVHLQHRWDSHQLSHVGNSLSSETELSNGETAPSTPQVHTSSGNSEDTAVMVGLMDEICEDAFVSNTIGGRPTADAHHSCTEGPMFLPNDLSLGGPVPLMDSENSRTSVQQNEFSPELIEGYCLSDLRSLSELTLGSQPSGAIPKYRSHSAESIDVGGKSGWYWDSSLTVLDDHMSDTSDWSSLKHSVNSEFTSTDCADLDDCEAMGHIVFKNLNFRWRMYGGTDWDNSRTSRNSNRVYGRDRAVCMELLLSDIECQYNSFPIGQFCLSKLSFTFKDIHLRDNSRDAPLKQVLGYYHSKDHPRDSASQAFRMELEAVRPDPSIPLEEYRLCISVIPLRLNLHQRQLEFFINFFGGEDVSRDLSPDGQKGIDRSKSSLSMQDRPPTTEIVDEALLPYFQKFDIKPLVVRVDYIPERVDLAALSGGKYVELVNLIPWKGVELQLKPVHAVGVYGWANVCETIAGEWLEDISQNQISKVIRGIPAIRSVTSIGSAAAKLISCPVESYKKDGRVLKGVQRGTIAFLRSISLEAVGLGVHLAAGAHDILLQAEYVLASKESAPAQGKCRPTTNVRSNQPKGAQHGIQKACGSIRDGLGKSASALIQKPMKKYQLGEGPGAAIATAVRGVPTAAISPVSACAGAVHYAFLGLRNSLDPEHKKESMEKYMGSDPSRE